MYRYFHRMQKGTTSDALPNTGPTNPPPMSQDYLLLCVNTQRHRTRLKQIPVGKNTRDMWLFQEISRQYFRTRGWRSRFTLKTVERIRFVKVCHSAAYLGIL